MFDKFKNAIAPRSEIGQCFVTVLAVMAAIGTVAFATTTAVGAVLYSD